MILTAAMVEAIEERAAILEYDAGLTRPDAELRARETVLAAVPGAAPPAPPTADYRYRSGWEPPKGVALPAVVLIAKEHITHKGAMTIWFVFGVDADLAVRVDHYAAPETWAYGSLVALLLPEIGVDGGEYELGDLVGRRCQVQLERKDKYLRVVAFARAEREESP